MKLVVATKNAHKIHELSEMLAIDGLTLVSLADVGFTGEIEENGATFAENALIKARAAAKFCGLPALADDSGLCVDALDGEPGIYSARYASEDGENAGDAANVKKLLENLKGIPSGERTARFVCAIALVLPDGTEKTVTGACEGVITSEIRGNGGFGYDPVFYLPELGMTYAELPSEQKNAISHRARALQDFCRKYQEVQNHDK